MPDGLSPVVLCEFNRIHDAVSALGEGVGEVRERVAVLCERSETMSESLRAHEAAHAAKSHEVRAATLRIVAALLVMCAGAGVTLLFTYFGG